MELVSGITVNIVEGLWRKVHGMQAGHKARATRLEDDFEILEPSASPMLESLRAFGYSAETAIADLIDNSISADASAVHVELNWNGGDPWVSVVDNGRGMSDSELGAAMRLGSKSPIETRGPRDLGRFGLGLKTASFSQGRQLTVVSKPRDTGQELAVRCWDLDIVQETNEWRILTVAPEWAAGLITSLLPGTGTAVIISKLDRLMGWHHETGSGSTRHDLLEIADRIASHLSLTFHRFLAGRPALSIFVNGKSLDGWDPFLRDHDSTWSPGPEELPLGGSSVRVEPFVLPHKSKMSSEAHSKAAGTRGWNGSQGFYVYRNDRLVSDATWLGLGGAHEEHSKLARIQLDIPSSLDHLWQVDVKKSSIKAPAAIHKDLRRIARMTKAKAQEVYRFRGKQLAPSAVKDFVVAWQARQVRGGARQYRLNRDHPLVLDALGNGLSKRADVERFMRFVEETVPVTQIGISVAESLDEAAKPFDGVSSEIRGQIEFLFSRLTEKGADERDALDIISTLEPFTYFPSIIQEFREEHT